MTKYGFYRKEVKHQKKPSQGSNYTKTDVSRSHASQSSIKSSNSKIWQGGEKSSIWCIPEFNELCLMLHKAYQDAEREEKQMKKSGMRKNFREGKSGKKSNISVGSKMSNSLKINDNNSVTPVIDSKESTISRQNESTTQILEELKEEEHTKQ